MTGRGDLSNKQKNKKKICSKNINALVVIFYSAWESKRENFLYI